MLSKELLSKLEELGKNEEVMSKLKMAESEDEVNEIMKAVDLKFTDDEKEQILNLVGEDGELSMDALDMVSGGSGWWYKINPLYWIIRKLTEKKFGC